MGLHEKVEREIFERLRPAKQWVQILRVPASPDEIVPGLQSATVIGYGKLHGLFNIETRAMETFGATPGTR